MVWQWIIRGMGIALLALCVTAWVGSYFKCVSVSYGSKTDRWTLDLVAGESAFSGIRAAVSRGWTVEHGQYYPDQRDRMRAVYKIIPYHALGFAWEPSRGFGIHPSVWIPLWFPSLVFALLLWFVWRKTRLKYSGKGFPVEVTKAEARKP
jgi:hypothetical protein